MTTALTISEQQTRYCPGCQTHRLVSEFSGSRHHPDRLALHCTHCNAKTREKQEEAKLMTATQRALKELVFSNSQDPRLSAHAKAVFDKLGGLEVVHASVADSLAVDLGGETSNTKSRDAARKYVFKLIEAQDQQEDVLAKLKRLSDEELQSIAFAIITQIIASQENIQVLQEAAQLLGYRLVRCGTVIEGEAEAC